MLLYCIVFGAAGYPRNEKQEPVFGLDEEEMSRASGTLRKGSNRQLKRSLEMEAN